MSQRDERLIEEWDRKVVWHGFTQMADYQPFIIARGEGNWLIDRQGKRYLDGASSMWCNVHGHRQPMIDQAIRDQLDRIAQVTSLGMGNDTTARLAGRLLEVVPSGLKHVFFSSDGTCAVEAALKLALQYWRQRADPRPEKTRLVALGAAYHGDTTGSVSLGGVERFKSLFAPLLFDTIRGPLPDGYRLPVGVKSDESCGYYLSQLETLLAQHQREIIAVVMEPLVQGAAGMVMHPHGFLRGVRELTRRYDCLLICDEVATGFGRTGRMFACDHEGVTPDVLCLGKGLTGGYLPMAATLTTSELWNAFLGPQEAHCQFFHGHTYSGNPLAAAAAIASLELFEQERVFEQLPLKASLLGEVVEPLRDHPHVGDIRQCGMMMGIEIVQHKEKRQAFEDHGQHARSICQRATDAGVWIRSLGDVVVVMPPLSILPAEIECLGNAVVAAVRDEF